MHSVRNCNVNIFFSPRPPSHPGTGRRSCPLAGQGFPPSANKNEFKGKKVEILLFQASFSSSFLFFVLMLLRPPARSPPALPPRRYVLDLGAYCGVGQAPLLPLPAPPPLLPPAPPRRPSYAVCAAAAPLPPRTRPLPGCWGRFRGPTRTLHCPAVAGRIGVSKGEKAEEDKNRLTWHHRLPRWYSGGLAEIDSRGQRMSCGGRVRPTAA